MRLKNMKLRLLAAMGVLGLAEAVASAQGCGPGGCGPTLSYGSALGFGCGSGCVGNGTALFTPDRPTRRPRPDGNQPACATRTYPISDWLYIRKYCGPSLIPGTCYGHFQPKWRRWSDICPEQGEGDGQCGVQGIVHDGALPPGAVISPGTPSIPGLGVPTAPGTVMPTTPGTTPLPTPMPLPMGTPGPGTSAPMPAPITPVTPGTSNLKPMGTPQSILPRLQPINVPQPEALRQPEKLVAPKY